MKKRLLYIDILRITASILVVAAHVCASYIDRLPIGSADFFTANAWDVFCVYSIPIFVMISGALNLAPKDDTERSDGASAVMPWVMRALRFMAIYFIWLMIYNLMNCYQEGYGFSALSIRRNVILASIQGHGIYHLWYLPMLAGLTLVTPLLKPVAADKTLSRYFCILFTIIVIIVPTILRFDFRFHTVLESLYERIPYVVVTGYTGYYILGYLLASDKNGENENAPSPLNGKKRSIVLILVIALMWLIGSLVCFYDSIAWGQLSTKLNDPFVITDLAASVCLFLLIRGIFSDTAYAPSEHKVISLLSSATLGIYIVHPAFLMIAGGLSFDTLFLPQILSLPIVTAGVYILSFVATRIYTRTKKILITRLKVL